MSEIDWMTLGLAAQADKKAAEAQTAQRQLQESLAALNMRDRQIAILERKLAEAEDELRHSKSQVAGFISEMRFFIEKLKNCSNPELSKLVESDEKGKRPIDYIYSNAYDDHWDNYQFPSR